MTVQARDGIDRFRNWVRPLLAAYPFLEVRSLARVKDGSIFNLYTKATLSPSSPDGPTHQLIQAHPSFRIGQDILPSRALPGLLDGLADEILDLPDAGIQLSTPDIDQNGKILPRSGPMWWHATRDQMEAPFWYGRSSSAEPVKAYGLNSNAGAGKALVSDVEWDELDSNLLRQRPRWLGVPDLVSRFLGVGHQWTIQHTTEFLIELPLRCELGAPQSLPKGRLSVPFTAPSRLRNSHLRVSGLFVSAAGTRWSKDAPVRSRSGSEVNGRAAFESVLPLSNASSVTLHLLLDDKVVSKAAYDLWSGKSPNPRMAALRSLGEALGQMEAVLQGRKGTERDSESLEIAVANLMAASGFVTIHAGKKHAKAGEVVDIVAIHPFAPVAFCIECTLGPGGNKEKLAKLEMRTRDLGRAMPGHTVKGVAVLAAEESSAADLAESSARGVTLLNRTHLRGLRTKVEWDAGPSGVAMWLLGNKQLPGPRG
jgi:hypothetical protein